MLAQKNPAQTLQKPTVYLWLFLFIFLYSIEVTAQQQRPVTSSFSTLQKGFETPPDSVKPFVYWYWLNDNISEKGVIKDIESMAKVGIGGAFIGNIGLERRPGTDDGKVKLFTREWWKITEAAIRTAAKNGIEIGMFNSPGWSQSGGPWIKPAQSMRYIASTEIQTEGPANLSVQIPAPDTAFQQVAVLAFPVPEKDGENIALLKPAITADTIIESIGNMIDNNKQTMTFLPKGRKAIAIDIKTTDLFTARSLTLYPASKTLRADIALQVKEGNDFRTIRRFEMDRGNDARNVGFIPFAPVSISFAPTTAKEFRLIIEGISGEAGFAEIEIAAAPRIERVAEKQLAKMFQTPLPLWNEYQWPRQNEPDSKSLSIDKTKVMDITAQVSKDGELNWQVPAGKWIIVRYGMVPTGVTNAPASPEGQGLDVDKMSKDAVAWHFKSFIQPIYDRIPAQYRKALKYVVADSYETGSQNWTDGFVTEFTKKYNYNPLSWLPVLSGRIVNSADESNRFLWDMRRMVADKVSYDYTGALRKESNKIGMKLWLENYGHWGFPGEFLQYGGQSDEVGGEFWAEGDLGSIEIKAAASAVNIYGKKRVWAESFTAAGAPFARYPALIKKRGDWAFTQGVNSTVMHVYISQPYTDRLPGVSTWFGTEFNHNNTWFLQGKAFIDYIRRCNFLLQQGKAVNDIAYFIGEDAPKMTGIRDPELPNGYSFDYINAEVIEKRVSVKNGKLVLPDGMSYRILVLPKLETMRPALLQKLKKLVQEGAIILGPSPDRSPSLQHYPFADKEVIKIAVELWGDTKGRVSKVRKYGKGFVLNNMTMQEALDTLKVLPDFEVNNDQPVLYTHRSYKGCEIYFVTNQSDQVLEISPYFRVDGLQPEWWDPVTGKQRNLVSFRQEQNRIEVPLKLEAYQSGFVVFRNTLKKLSANSSNFPNGRLLSTLTNPWIVQFDTAMRGPLKPVVFNQLTDWSVNSDEQIKNYSGTAIYAASFNLDKIPTGEIVYMNLGVVNVMAKVKLNGIDMGTVWTAPWHIDITKALKQGENKVEIEVVNTWVNRLIGDSKLPEAERKTWTSTATYSPDSKYEPAGLIGSVTIQGVKY